MYKINSVPTAISYMTFHCTSEY